MRSTCIVLILCLTLCTSCSTHTTEPLTQTNKPIQPSTTAVPEVRATIPRAQAVIPQAQAKQQRASAAPTRKPAEEVSKRVQSSVDQRKKQQQERAARSYRSLSQLQHKYPAIFKNSGSAHNKQIALTFDDVPAAFTHKILDVLKKYDVKATFFVVGNRAEAHPEIVKRIVREGHLIGNHSYNHPLMTRLSMESFKRQIMRTDQILYRLTGYHPKYIRPPYGEINERELRWVGQQGHIIVNWDVDSQDWRGISAQRVYSNILNYTQPGSIILQHASGNANGVLQGTLSALPRVIEKLESEGYHFVTLNQMF